MERFSPILSSHGALTMSLIEAMTSKTLYTDIATNALPADRNGDGIVDFEELKRYAIPRVGAVTRGGQTPSGYRQNFPRQFPIVQFPPATGEDASVF